MTKLPLTKVLLIILVLQGGILIFKNPSAAILQVNASSSEFIKFDPSAVTKIKIEQPDKSLELEKTTNGWILPASENIPADEGKIKQLINDLQELKTTSPIATSLSAAKKLKTGVDGYEKKLSILSGGKEEVLFFGSSPTFKKLYARLNGTDNTYIVDYQVSELTPNPDSWFSGSLLNITPKDLDLVEFEDILLEQSDGILGFATVPEDKQVDRKELEAFVNKLTQMSYSQMPKLAVPAGWEKAPVIVTYDLTLKGVKQNYLIKGPIKFKVEEKEEEKFFLKTGGQPFYFELSKYEIDALTAFSLDKILKEKEAKKEESEEKAPVEVPDVKN